METTGHQLFVKDQEEPFVWEINFCTLLPCQRHRAGIFFLCLLGSLLYSSLRDYTSCLRNTFPWWLVQQIPLLQRTLLSVGVHDGWGNDMDFWQWKWFIIVDYLWSFYTGFENWWVSLCLQAVIIINYLWSLYTLCFGDFEFWWLASTQQWRNLEINCDKQVTVIFASGKEKRKSNVVGHGLRASLKRSKNCNCW